MVDNGRNDCVDSMVNDVESFSTTKEKHNKVSDAPLSVREKMSLSTCVTVSS
jgi:hypothetical protein